MLKAKVFNIGALLIKKELLQQLNIIIVVMIGPFSQMPAKLHNVLYNKL